MFGGLFGNKKTSKTDVVMAVGAAVMAVWKAFDTVKEYRSDKDTENKEITQ